PKFYKSVIDDVVSNVRELFLDDGVDEQVIQELKKLWEEKIAETKATDHPTVAQPSTTTTNSKSNNSKKSAAAAAAAAAAAIAAASSNSTSAATSNSLNAAAASGATSSSSAAGGQTSVIKSNPNHVKNGPSNNSPVGRVKDDSQQNDQPMGTAATSSDRPAIQEINKYPALVNSATGQKMVLLPQHSGSFVMGMPGNPQATSYVLTQEMLSQMGFQGVSNNAFNLTAGQPLLPQGLPSTIQYAARAAAPISQQATIGFVPGQVVGQTPGQAPNAVANARVAQLDGHNDDSSSDDDDEDEYRDNDDDDNDDEMNDEENDGGIEDEEPLNSGDDVSDEDPNELFDTDNVVVCQYDKITRSRNKWKFHFKDGIMNLHGKDYVFQKAVGDAEW
ncbi:PREDICTED: transcription initiation factor IIA subunit 1-like, partial [Rhagoletis zephyria]|uniref:transcription initiation factor IIA subunit 1-like n=1 Tax=Rhagoletis zephyria TaxID=28612 RepID=UPI0008116B02